MTTLIGAKEFAKLLRVSLRTLDSLDKKGELPMSLRVGHVRRWRITDIEEWITTNLKGPQNQKTGNSETAIDGPQK